MSKINTVKATATYTLPTKAIESVGELLNDHAAKTLPLQLPGQRRSGKSLPDDHKVERLFFERFRHVSLRQSF